MWWPSLDDYTGWSMGKIGATSLILDAFTAIEPKAADIDRIRQWLILQKEAKDWGTSVTTADAIASILTSGSRWTVAAEGATVKIGDTTVNPDKAEKITGYFRPTYRLLIHRGPHCRHTSRQPVRPGERSTASTPALWTK